MNVNGRWLLAFGQSRSPFLPTADSRQLIAGFSAIVSLAADECHQPAIHVGEHILGDVIVTGILP
jgi:hypothetical protein